ncbi:MAG: helix-turn-helix transcriptional regulator [Clostridia bacterium]|nr:helix-turn-helix transcriptional regulator [Clostridia bacterium]
MNELEFMKEMGHRIMLRRKALGLTQEELSEMVGVSTQMISNLELGKKAIRPMNLAKVSKALDLSADYILSGGKSHGRIDEVSEKLAALSDSQLQTVSDLIDHFRGKK